MKTITIRIPDVEAAMLVEVRKKNREFVRLDLMVLSAIRAEYQRSK